MTTTPIEQPQSTTVINGEIVIGLGFDYELMAKHAVLDPLGTLNCVRTLITNQRIGNDRHADTLKFVKFMKTQYLEPAIVKCYFNTCVVFLKELKKCRKEFEKNEDTLNLIDFEMNRFVIGVTALAQCL